MAAVDLAAVSAVGQLVAAAGDEEVLLVRSGGAVQAYVAGADVVYCPASGRLEAADGRVWSRQGRLLGGEGASLEVLPTVVHDGVVYVDPTNGTLLDPAPQDVEAACVH